MKKLKIINWECKLCKASGTTPDYDFPFPRVCPFCEKPFEIITTKEIDYE